MGLQKLHCNLAFLHGGAATGDQAVGAVGDLDRMRAGLAAETVGQGLGQTVREVAVQQLQGLRGVGALLAARATELQVRGVEDLHKGQAQVALEDQVGAAAVVLFGVGVDDPLGRLVELVDQLLVYRHHDAGPAGRAVQLAGGQEHGVADLLGFQAPAGETPQQLVLGVLGQSDGGDGGVVGLLITTAAED